MAKKTVRERTDAAFEYLLLALVWAWIVLLCVGAGVGAAALIGVAVGH